MCFKLYSIRVLCVCVCVCVCVYNFSQLTPRRTLCLPPPQVLQRARPTVSQNDLKDYEKFTDE